MGIEREAELFSHFAGVRFGAFAWLSADTGRGETGACEGRVWGNFVTETGFGEGATHDVAVADEEDGRGRRCQFCILAASELRWLGRSSFVGQWRMRNAGSEAGEGFPEGFSGRELAIVDSQIFSWGSTEGCQFCSEISKTVEALGKHAASRFEIQS